MAAALPPRTLLLCCNVALYAACFQMQTPLLPFLTTSLGADLATYGRLMTLFSVVQFAGGLLAGPVLDAYGARFVLLCSYGSSALCYGMTAAARSMLALYASRLPTLLQHAVLATRAAVTEASSEADRARVLGLVGVAYGVGMALGPALGGALARHDLRLACWVAAAGSLISVLSIAASMPSDTRRKQAAVTPAAEKRPSVSLADIGRVSLLPGVPSLLTVKALAGFASAVFHSAFPLVVTSRFGLDARGSGLVLSYTGLLAIVAQAGVIDWATRRYEDARIVRACAVGMLLSFAALAGASSTAQLVVLLAPLVVCATVLARAACANTRADAS